MKFFFASNRLFLRCALTALCLPVWAAAQPACVEPAANQFRTDVLVPRGTLEEANLFGPVQMAIAPDGRVFIAKMGTGEIRVYDPVTQAVTLAGTIPTWGIIEDGLLGIVLAPDFATSHWLYAFFSDPATSGANRGMVLARFTVGANSQITNRKELLRFPRESSNRHGAGGLSIDAGGTLVFGTGDNTDPFGVGGYAPTNTAAADGDAQRSASNSNDLRGKILRIKPVLFPDNQTPVLGIGTTYTVPAGNLWEKIDDPVFNPGWNSSDNIALVRKEIFTIGHRNPYHVRIDSRTGWVFWGEIGPDANTDDAVKGPAGHEEWNLAKGPGFYGHPYCNGYNRAWGVYNPATATYPGGFYSCTSPVNNSTRNTGVHHLPPAIPALVAYSSGNSTDDDPRFNAGSIGTTIQHGSETGIGGPMYRYNPSLPAGSGKLPPYYEGKVCFIEWNRKYVRWIVLDSDGKILPGAAGVRAFTPAGLPAACWIDAQFGPDGALYLLKYNDGVSYTGTTNSGLYRVSYTGAYDDACYKPFGPTVGTRPSLQQRVAPGLSGGFFKLPKGYRSVVLFGADGRQVWSFHREEAGRDKSVKLPARLSKGMWRARLEP